MSGSLLSLHPFPAIGERGQSFLQPAGARFRQSRRPQPHDVFALIRRRQRSKKCRRALMLRQRFREMSRHREGLPFFLRQRRHGKFRIQFHRCAQQFSKSASVHLLQRGDSYPSNIGVVLSAGCKKLRRIRQFRAAKKSHAQMPPARANAADQLAPRKTKHVPLDRLRQVRLPFQNPLAKLVRQRPGKFRPRFQPLDGVFGL